jgi:hypothetical protein
MQHDIWGTMLDSVYLHAKSREQVPENLWPVLKEQVEEAIKHWRDPDRGIWEVRGEPSISHRARSCAGWHWTVDPNSPVQGEKSYAQQWRAIAEEIKDDILTHGVDDRGVLTQRYGDDALDASLLLAVLTRFLPPDDPRIRATVMAIAEELTEDGLVLRYRVQETDDGLSGEEGTFHHLFVLAGVGPRRDRRFHQARHLCERLLGFASPLPYAEEIEPRTGRHLGNFPQAFTHLALINAVVHVIRAEEEADSSGVFQPASAHVATAPFSASSRVRTPTRRATRTSADARGPSSARLLQDVIPGRYSRTTCGRQAAMAAPMATRPPITPQLRWRSVSNCRPGRAGSAGSARRRRPDRPGRDRAR